MTKNQQKKKKERRHKATDADEAEPESLFGTLRGGERETPAKSSMSSFFAKFDKQLSVAKKTTESIKATSQSTPPMYRRKGSNGPLMPHAAAMTRAGRLQAASSGLSLLESMLFTSEKKFEEKDEKLLNSNASPSPNPNPTPTTNFENDILERDLGVFEL